MAAGANVAEHGRRRYATQFHLVSESREQFATPLRAAASLTWCGANEDLAHLPHTQILCRNQKKSRLIASKAFRGGIDLPRIAHSAWSADKKLTS